jgi:hypothetical protein
MIENLQAKNKKTQFLWKLLFIRIEYANKLMLLILVFKRSIYINIYLIRSYSSCQHILTYQAIYYHYRYLSNTDIEAESIWLHDNLRII